MTQTVLLVGATGMFGSRIAHHVLEQPDARLRVLLRPGGGAEKQRAATTFRDRGAEVAEGDLGDRGSLDRATQGVDVIVSAIQGGSDVIVDGQVALAEIGMRNGVRRILPSDYALDLFKATPGEHTMFDLRRDADGAIDYDGGIVTFWGDGAQPIEVTSVEDTARMVAQIALDRSVESGKFAFAGDRISILDAARVIEAQTGRRFARHSRGSEADLRAAHANAGADTSNPYAAVMLAYQLYMLTGQTALSDLQNGRYPDIALETFADFAARMLPKVAG